MAIGTPDFRQRGRRSPIDLAFQLDRRRRVEDQGILGGLGLDQMMQLGQMLGPSLGDQAADATVGGGGVTMPMTARGGIEPVTADQSAIFQTFGVTG